MFHPPTHLILPGELSTIARQGSGSACRSLYGGFVRWEMGSPSNTTSSDSMAVQVADEAHWTDLVLLIAVVSDKKKDTGSTDGMQRAVATSALLAHRAAAVVPARLAAIEKAYVERDFASFAKSEWGRKEGGKGNLLLQWCLRQTAINSLHTHLSLTLPSGILAQLLWRTPTSSTPRAWTPTRPSST